MVPSKRSLEILMDLVEIKLGMLEVADREDARERRALEQCRRELAALEGDARAGTHPGAGVRKAA